MNSLRIKTLAYVGVIAFICLFPAMLVMPGCTSTQQRTAANTLQSLEAGATQTVSSYYDGVLKGVISTNDVPKVAHAYNDFQAAYALAVITAQNNTNALAPEALVQEATALGNLVTTVSHK